MAIPLGEMSSACTPIVKVRNRKPLANILLIFHCLIGVIVFVNGEEQVDALGNVRTLIIQQTIAEQVFHADIVRVTTETEQCVRKTQNILLEHIHHVVIEYFATRRAMHQENGLFGFCRKISLLPVEKEEVGNGLRIVIVQSICVEYDKAHVTRSKGEVRIAEYLTKHVFTRAEVVVVADGTNIWYLEFAQDIALPDKFSGHAEVG